MAIVWILLFSGLFELSMVVFIFLVHRAIQAEEQRELRRERQGMVNSA